MVDPSLFRPQLPPTDIAAEIFTVPVDAVADGVGIGGGVREIRSTRDNPENPSSGGEDRPVFTATCSGVNNMDIGGKVGREADRLTLRISPGISFGGDDNDRGRFAGGGDGGRQ